MTTYLPGEPVEDYKARIDRWYRKGRMGTEVRGLLALDRDDGDPWGWAIGHAFAIADLLTVAGEEVPAEAEYRPSPLLHVGDFDTEDWPDCEWIELYLDGYVSAEQLRYTLRVLCRYLDWCKRAGKDY